MWHSKEAISHLAWCDSHLMIKLELPQSKMWWNNKESDFHFRFTDYPGGVHYGETPSRIFLTVYKENKLNSSWLIIWPSLFKMPSFSLSPRCTQFSIPIYLECIYYPRRLHHCFLLFCLYIIWNIYESWDTRYFRVGFHSCIFVSWWILNHK